MGKKKGKGSKKPNVFKVAGAKSLRAKKKAKPVLGNLRKIKETVRSNISQIDEALVHLERDLRHKKEAKPKGKPKPGQRKDEGSKKKSPAEVEADSKNAMKMLTEMKF